MTTNIKFDFDYTNRWITLQDDAVRAYSRDNAVKITVCGLEQEDAYDSTSVDHTPPGTPIVQVLNQESEVIAEAYLKTTMSGTAPATDSADKYSFEADISLNTDKMLETFAENMATVMCFPIRVMLTTSGNKPFAAGCITVYRFPSDTDADTPVELASANAVLAGIRNDLDEHIEDTDNPHGVTAAQIGALTRTQADALYGTLAAITSAVGTAQAATAAAQNVAANLASHVGNMNNPHSVTKSQVGLGNVNNTSDLDKPVSTLQQAAINSAVATLSAQVTAALASYYLKTETYSKGEVNALVAAIPQMEMVVVDALPSVGDAKKIYLLRKAGGTGTSRYYEYIYVASGWELIGEQHDVDLTDYAKKSYITGLLDGYVAKVTGKGLSTEDFTSAFKTKLSRAVVTVNGKSADADGNVETKVLAATDIFDMDCNDWGFRTALASLWSKLGGTVTGL